MSDKMRWRYGETNPVLASVSETVAIEIGDLVFYESGTAKPASEQPNQTTKSANQSLFVTKFLGVAMQKSPLGESGEIRVATGGVFEFDCHPSTFELGQLVGIEEQPLDAGLENQKVTGVTSLTNALGRVVKREPMARPLVLVAVHSKMLCGSLT